MATTTHPEVEKQPGTIAVPDISLIDDGHEYETYRPSRWPRIVAILVALGVLVVGGYFAAAYFLPSTAAAGSAIKTVTVEKATLPITVTESGTLESAKNLDIKCEIAGGTTILWIVEDGKQVYKGDKLVELDSSALREQVTQQEIVVERARSTETQADKSLEVAKINVREYEEGTFVQSKQTSESAITVAEENLRSAKNALEHTQRMFRKGYATSLELEAAKFAVKRGELDLDAAKTALDVLVNFTKEKMLEDLRSQVATAEATLSAEKKALELEVMKLERLNVQLTKSTIYAPESGMVVYANDSGRRGNDAVQIAEGAAVREQQTILRLPDLNQMQAKAQVHEARVDSIQVGMGASIEVLNRKMRGTVTSIANQPAQTGGWMPSTVKKYDTVISIEAGGPADFDLKPGMTAEVTILIDNVKDVVAVPLTAVRQGNVWVKDGNGFKMQPVKVGQSNDDAMAILEGLSVGDVVAVNPEYDFKDQVARLQSDSPTLSVEERFGRGNPEALDAAGRGERGGRGRGGRGGAGGAAGFSPDSIFQGMDTNGDGSISRDEVSGPMADRFGDIDANKDDKISKEEMTSAMSKMSQGAQQ